MEMQIHVLTTVTVPITGYEVRLNSQLGQFLICRHEAIPVVISVVKQWDRGENRQLTSIEVEVWK